MSRVNVDGLIVECDVCTITVSRPGTPGPDDTPEEWADYLLYRQRNTSGWVGLSPSSVASLRAAIVARMGIEP